MGLFLDSFMACFLACLGGLFVACLRGCFGLKLWTIFRDCLG